MEIFIVYYTGTGEIKSSGRVDTGRTPDGTTIFEKITQYLAIHQELDVLYFPNQELPDKTLKQVVEGVVVDRQLGFKTLKELEQERVNEFTAEQLNLKGLTLVQKEDWVRARLQETTLDTPSKVALGNIFKKLIAFTER